jgi:hypothetical protein
VVAHLYRCTEIRWQAVGGVPGNDARGAVIGPYSTGMRIKITELGSYQFENCFGLIVGGHKAKKGSGYDWLSENGTRLEMKWFKLHQQSTSLHPLYRWHHIQGRDYSYVYDWLILGGPSYLDKDKIALFCVPFWFVDRIAGGLTSRKTFYRSARKK